MNTANAPIDFAALERPSPKLLNYYLITALLSGPGVFFAVVPLLFRYNTLRYRFEESGIRMQVGVFFRKEVVVAFRRIQDIHVSRNLIQRWLGIASVSIQTASGNAMPEIVLEGMTNEDAIRDWLYERMRGAKGHSNPQRVSATEAYPLSSNAATDSALPSSVDSDEATELLRGIRDNLARMLQNQGSKS